MGIRKKNRLLTDTVILVCILSVNLFCGTWSFLFLALHFEHWFNLENYFWRLVNSLPLWRIVTFSKQAYNFRLNQLIMKAPKACSSYFWINSPALKKWCYRSVATSLIYQLSLPPPGVWLWSPLKTWEESLIFCFLVRFFR